jgi:hypothetical protein
MRVQKNILIVYHSQGGTMAALAHRFARGAAREEEVSVTLRRAGEATLDDLLRCRAIAIGSPEYFGTMAGMIKDFFDRTYTEAQERTIGLPFVLLVCAGNDDRGAITQMERLTAGYKPRARRWASSNAAKFLPVRGLAGQLLLGPGQGRHGPRKAHGGHEQQQGVANLGGTGPGLQGPAGVGADRALGLHGRGRGQLDQLRGFRVERAGGAQGCTEPFDAVYDLGKLLAYLAIERGLVVRCHGNLLAAREKALRGQGRRRYAGMGR